MREKVTKLLKNRTLMHVVFWISWILGFTFIKSFGQSYQNYLGWFSYYMLTLPIFVSHTYLIAYVLLPHFFSKRFWPLFTIFFLLLFYGFSVAELILSNEFIYQWYPTGSEVIENYLAPGNVVRSGLGNLYIILVFFAVRTVREWFRADLKKRELMQLELKQQMENTMIRVQPMMLLYAVESIDKMVEESSGDVTRAIASTSELLSEVMMYNEGGQQLISREIDLVKKLVSLVGLLRGSKPDVEFFISGDLGEIDLPPMILFSFVDLLFRRFDSYDDFPELIIEASGFSNMMTIQVLRNGSGWRENELEDCMNAIKRLERKFVSGVDISFEKQNYGCSVIITTYSVSNDVGSSYTADG